MFTVYPRREVENGKKKGISAEEEAHVIINVYNGSDAVIVYLVYRVNLRA